MSQEINGTDLHQWAIEQVATQIGGIAAVTVRSQVSGFRKSGGDVVMQAEVHFAELYWAAKGDYLLAERIVNEQRAELKTVTQR